MQSVVSHSFTVRTHPSLCGVLCISHDPASFVWRDSHAQRLLPSTPGATSPCPVSMGSPGPSRPPRG
eukprot:13532629-Alexandrium_andersonii.AAC.1